MAWLVTRLWMAKSIHLNHVVVHLPWATQKASIERHLSRFLHNPTVHVRTWYEPIARMLVARAIATKGEMRLILNTMPIHQRAQVVIVSLAFRRRALPLAWTWVRKGEGHSRSVKQTALLALYAACARKEVHGYIFPKQTIGRPWRMWSRSPARAAGIGRSC